MKMKLITLMINNQQDVDEMRILTSRFDFVIIYKFSVQR